jgi:hypothetical protein
MEGAIAQPALPLIADAARAGVGVFRHKLTRKWSRWRGTVAADDFNSVEAMERASTVKDGR